MSSDKRPGRRRFLKIALATTGATAAAGGGGYLLWRRRPIEGAPIVEDRPGYVHPGARVETRRRLGRTGLDIGVVGIGAGGLQGHEPILRAVDRGMNFIDTSICYGDSEKVIRRALLADKSLRQKLVIATKWDPGTTTTKKEMLDSLDKSLSRLNVDHVDIMQVHWLGGGHKFPDDGFNRLDNPELYLAMEEARKSGKVRFFGATSHAGKRSAILQHAIDKGAFDMILVKMNVLDHEDADIPALLAKARDKDVGVVVMKSQPGGGRIPKAYEESRYDIYQANLRWVLDHPEVACVVESKIGREAAYQDLAIAAVQEQLGRRDHGLLDRYATALSPDYCRGCGDTCAAACPDGVAIDHVLQFSMYDREYGWHERAREHYRELPAPARWSDRCATCSACTDACPYGVDAASGVREARARLG
ncbi:MAG: aldo/keto reductase [Polyangiaceae bacterium]|nr:aldo/keto reductase [Polyangiaceae bacterium]